MHVCPTPSCTAGNCIGKGNSQRYGCVSINTKLVSGIYKIIDHARLQNEILNINESTGSTGTIYDDSCNGCSNNNIWGNGTAFNESTEATYSTDGQTDGVDAAYVLQEAWDYFNTIHSHKGLNGSGGKTGVGVHAKRGGGGGGGGHCNPNDSNCPRDDGMAWYLPSTSRIYTTDNFISLDIVGHEYSHGVHLNLQRLTFYDGETGALAEATGDIFGTLIEWLTGDPNDPGDWTMAERVGTPVRSLSKPSTTGGADFYETVLSQATNGCNPATCITLHEAAGPADHFFYYLLYGVPTSGSNASPYLPQGMTGMGTGATARKNAGKIWYRALRSYMTGTTNYLGARLATLDAADDLEFSGTIPAGTRTKVKNAWKAVNVPPVPGEDDFCKTCL